MDIPATISRLAYSHDVTDDPFIHAAMSAGETRLISGDDDLLTLHPLGNLHIVNPRAALEEINKLNQAPQ